MADKKTAAATKKATANATKKTATKKAEGVALAKQVKKAHASTGKPVSPTEDPTIHATSAQAINEMSGGKKEVVVDGGAKEAATIDAVNARELDKEAAERAEVDNTIVGKIRRSELFAVNDHPNGGGWKVAISPQNDPNASEASKRLSNVQPLDTFPPRTGMQVFPKDGEPFQIGEGFGLDTTPADWARVTSPDGKPLFS